MPALVFFLSVRSTNANATHKKVKLRQSSIEKAKN